MRSNRVPTSTNGSQRMRLMASSLWKRKSLSLSTLMILRQDKRGCDSQKYLTQEPPAVPIATRRAALPLQDLGGACRRRGGGRHRQIAVEARGDDAKQQSAARRRTDESRVRTCKS